MTHDYKRHGTATLFAALSVLDGTVIGRCMQRHRHVEFIRFLNTVERAVAADKSIHVVLDNYATHKHPKVLAWLTRHSRWTFHFTPTSASWLNAVENFFSKMTRQRIRRGIFRSVVDLQAAINAYLAEHNANPKPFIWTKSAEAILAKLNRCPSYMFHLEPQVVARYVKTSRKTPTLSYTLCSRLIPLSQVCQYLGLAGSKPKRG
jgi:transposase